jgi:hypothetical protein
LPADAAHAGLDFLLDDTFDAAFQVPIIARTRGRTGNRCRLASSVRLRRAGQCRSGFGDDDHLLAVGQQLPALARVDGLRLASIRKSPRG